MARIWWLKNVFFLYYTILFCFCQGRRLYVKILTIATSNNMRPHMDPTFRDSQVMTALVSYLINKVGRHLQFVGSGRGLVSTGGRPNFQRNVVAYGVLRLVMSRGTLAQQRISTLNR